MRSVYRSAGSWAINRASPGPYTISAMSRIFRERWLRPAPTMWRACGFYWELQDRRSIASTLGKIGLVACQQGDAASGVPLLGGAEAVFDSLGVKLLPDEATEQERAVAQARQQLGEPAAEAAWNAGRALSFDQALAYVPELYGLLSRPTPQPHCTVCLIPKRFGTDRATRKGRGGESAQADLALWQPRMDSPGQRCPLLNP